MTAGEAINKVKDIILAMLEYAGGRVKGKTRIHKGLFILHEDVDPSLVPATFEPRDYGPWSPEVEEALRQLEREGLVEKRVEPGGDEAPAEVYMLTEKGRERGRKALEELRARSDWGSIETVFQLATKAPLLNLLAYVYTMHPEYSKYSRIKYKVRSYARRRALRLL